MTCTRLTIACGVAVLLASAATAQAAALDASTAHQKAVDRFTFDAGPAKADSDDHSGTMDHFELVIDHWSTDAERDRLHEAAATPDRLFTRLRESWSAGRVTWPGNLSYTVRYARRVMRPDGSETVVVATDAPIWQWWSEKGSMAAAKGRFAVIELHVDPSGHGEGRLSVSGQVAGDAQLGVTLADFADQPAAVRQVRRAPMQGA